MAIVPHVGVRGKLPLQRFALGSAPVLFFFVLCIVCCVLCMYVCIYACSFYSSVSIVARADTVSSSLFHCCQLSHIS